MNIKELLDYTQKQGASDLHLSTGLPPTIRLHGVMAPLKHPPIPAENLLQLVHSIMSEEQKKLYETELEIDFSFAFSKESRFRVNAFHTINGPAAVLRTIPTEIMTLEELGLPPVLSKLTNLSKGIVLVTGPTGSGKSTTLAAMINEVNKHHRKHIITIEDPVEFVHRSNRCVINQREVGTSTLSFANALKSALREDPDVILVGELRDHETVSLALTAAETGHLVFGTLHTNSAAKTIDRIIDVFPEGDKPMIRTMLATSVEAIITQLLVKRSDKPGRRAVHDILLANSAIRNLIRENKIAQIPSMMEVGRKRGMQLLKDDIARCLSEGIINQEEANYILNVESDIPERPASKEDEAQDETHTISSQDDF